MAKPILDGLVICDFSWVGAGPITTQNLGMMGATVIHIETHKRPEILRMNPPFKDRKPGVERSGYFSPRNANKLGLSLDLSKPEAIAVVKRLLTISDILSSSLTLAVRTVIWAISVSTCLRQAGKGEHRIRPLIIDDLKLFTFHKRRHPAGFWPEDTGKQP